MRKSAAPGEIARAILVLRGHRVLLDAELAALYGVTPSPQRAGQAQCRALPSGFHIPADPDRDSSSEPVAKCDRFPEASRSALRALRLHRTWRHHGRHDLKQPARDRNERLVVRAFVQLREMLASNRELARRFAQLETRLDKKLTIHDEAIAAILSAIRQLMHPPVPKRRPIGFTADLRERV